MRSLVATALLVSLCLGLPAVPVLADDIDLDALDDSFISDPGTGSADATVAIVDVGSSVADFQTRLLTAGYSSTPIPVTSNLSVLSQYDIVLLPVSHATPAYYTTLNALAQDYHDYVNAGGKLWIGQPNPYQMPGNTADITWAPYALTINNGYNTSDCPTLIVDPNHCIAQGITGADLPFAGDTVTQMGTEWHVVGQGPATGLPAVFIADYGHGACLVELGHPSPNAICPYTNAGFSRLVECLLAAGLPSPIDPSTWGQIKSYFE
jgi:hypothetical protein